MSDPPNVGRRDDPDEPGRRQRPEAVARDLVGGVGLVVGVKLKPEPQFLRSQVAFELEFY